MDAREKKSVDSLILANGKYTVSISQRGGNYIIHLENVDHEKSQEVKHRGRPIKLQVVKEEGEKAVAAPTEAEKQIRRGRGRPANIKVVQDEPTPVKRGRGRPRREIAQEVMVEPPKLEKRRGRPAKMQAHEVANHIA